jgi:hypothetical protein
MGYFEPTCDACGASLPDDTEPIRKHGKRRHYYTTSDNRRLCAECWKNPANFPIPLAPFRRAGSLVTFGVPRIAD